MTYSILINKQKLAAKESKKDTRLDSENEKLIKEFNVAHYDSNIINPETLKQAIQKFKDVPGALDKNGPLKQILTNGKLGLKINPSLKGNAYELEKALELEGQGKKVIEFGKKINGKEFDIVTENTFVECKNWEWARVKKDQLNKFKSTLPHLKDLAKSQGKYFELHSKNKLTPDIKEWLNGKEIIFVEG